LIFLDVWLVTVFNAGMGVLKWKRYFVLSGPIRLCSGPVQLWKMVLQKLIAYTWHSSNNNVRSVSQRHQGANVMTCRKIWLTFSAILTRTTAILCKILNFCGNFSKRAQIAKWWS
jgi:hypothetical protein